MQVTPCKQTDKPNATKYIVKTRATEIGYGYILQGKHNPIEVYIYKEYQSAGYGKKVFKKLLQIAKQNNPQIYEFTIPAQNYAFKSIVAQAGGKYLSTNGETETWII